MAQPTLREELKRLKKGISDDKASPSEVLAIGKVLQVEAMIEVAEQLENLYGTATDINVSLERTNELLERISQKLSDLTSAVANRG